MTQTRIIELQTRYTNEISRLQKDKQMHIEELTNKIHKAQEKQIVNIDDTKPISSFKLQSVTPQQINRSFTVLRQDTGSTGTRFIKHRRQKSDSRSRNMSKHRGSMLNDT